MECQFNALEACPGSKTRLDALLRSLPRTLDKTYERMLLGIEEGSADDAKRILTLLCTAKRPLSVTELTDGIAVELGDDPRFNVESRLMCEEEIRRSCPGFIEVDRASNGRPLAVRIAHYSVQEYLESDRIRQSGAARFGIGPIESNTEVACICLVYLLDMERDSSPDLSLWDLQEHPVFGYQPRYPLAEYAANNWPYHYREGKSDDARLNQLAVRLFCGGNAVFLDSFLSIWGRYNAPVPSPIDQASWLGLNPVLRVLLSGSELPTACSGGGRHGEALNVAAHEGHVTTVKLLLDSGADISYKGRDGTALQRATKRGFIEVVEVLLDRGADTEEQDGSALYTATKFGHEQLVRLLLERDADVNYLVAGGETPLAAAVGMTDANTSIFKLLLDKGAEVERAGGYSGLLERAVCAPNEELVRFLLDKGADIERAGGYWRLLQETVFTGHVGIMQLLLEKCADVERAGGYARLLEMAVFIGDKPMVRFLLDHGADVDKAYNFAPLETACIRLDRSVTHMLLSLGADANHGMRRTPLECVMARWSWAMAMPSWDPEADGGGGGLDCNDREEDTDDVDAGGDDSDSITDGYRELEDSIFEWWVDLLVRNGADVNRGKIMTPLETAVARRKTTMVKVLLDRGADINAPGIRSKNALDMARSTGSDKMVRLLLSRGAEDEAKTPNGGGDDASK